MSILETLYQIWTIEDLIMYEIYQHEHLAYFPKIPTSTTKTTTISATFSKILIKDIAEDLHIIIRICHAFEMLTTKNNERNYREE